jgi:hypothetical protein
MNQGLFLHDVRPHMNVRTGWAVLPRAPYSPNLSPSLRLLSFWAPEVCTPTAPFCGRRRPEQTSIKSFDASAKSFTRLAYSVSHKGGKSVLIMKDILWKNNRNFMNDVCTISIEFIINAIVVSEKK